MPRRAIIGSKKFKVILPANPIPSVAIIDAFDEALGKILKRLVVWILRTGEGAQSRSQPGVPDTKPGEA